MFTLKTPIVLVTLAGLASAAHAQQLRGIGSALPGGNSGVYTGNAVTNVKPGGQLRVVGRVEYAPAQYIACVWSPATDLSLIGTFGGPSSYAQAISADGSTIVGYADVVGGYQQAFRFDTTSGGQVLGSWFTPGYSTAQSVTDHGEIVVGSSQPANFSQSVANYFQNGFRINYNFTLPGSPTFASFNDITGDGQYAVGSTGQFPNQHAVIYHNNNGLEMSTPEYDQIMSVATAVRNDGKAACGYRSDFTGVRPVLWMEGVGCGEIGIPGGKSRGILNDMAADTAFTSVGWAYNPEDTVSTAIIISPEGNEFLSDYLARHGVDTSGWHLAYASSISPDGKTIAGTGLHEYEGGNGAVRYEIFVATIEGTLCGCPADFDGSGGTPDASDIDAYFQAWLNGNPSADSDCSGGTPDASDIDAFFMAWLNGGC